MKKMILFAVLLVIILCKSVYANDYISQFTYQDDGSIFTSINLKDQKKAPDFDLDVSLFSEIDEKISDVVYSFGFKGDILSGSFEATITADNEREIVAYLAVYDESKLAYICKQDVNLADGGSDTVYFEEISAEILSDVFKVNLFVWEKEGFVPVCDTYEFSVNYSPEIYVDGFLTEVTRPMYIYDGEIMVPAEVLQNMGVIVQHDEETDIIYTMKNNQYVYMQIGNKTIVSEKGDERISYTASRTPSISFNTIYIPMSTICKAYNFDYEIADDTMDAMFYTNEVLRGAERDVSTLDLGISSIGTNITGSAVINNGLIYYTVLDESNIYITNGSATITYSTGGIVSDLIVEGDWIYYRNLDNGYLYKMYIYTGERTALFWVSDFSYFNGKIYTNNHIYSLASNEVVTEYDYVSDFAIADKKYIYGVKVTHDLDSEKRFHDVILDIRKIDTDTGEYVILDDYTITYSKANQWHYFSNMYVCDNKLYIELDNDYVDGEKYFCASFGETTGTITTATKSEYSTAYKKSGTNADKFAQTSTPPDYKYLYQSGGIVKYNPKTTFTETLVSKPSGYYVSLWTASDSNVIYAEYTLKSNSYVIGDIVVQVMDTNGNYLGALGVYQNGVYTPLI